jgi:hypothetical protein
MEEEVVAGEIAGWGAVCWVVAMEEGCLPCHTYLSPVLSLRIPGMVALHVVGSND